MLKPYRKTWQCEFTYPLLHRTGGRRDPMLVIGDEQPVEGFSEMGLRQFSTVSLITKYTKNTERIRLFSNDIWLYCTAGDQQCIFRVISTKLDCHGTKFTDIWQNMNVNVSFGQVSQLLQKLQTDLHLSFHSFLKEFVAQPNDGVRRILLLWW